MHPSSCVMECVVYCPVDGSGNAVDAAYEMARRLSEAGVRRMSGEIPVCCTIKEGTLPYFLHNFFVQNRKSQFIFVIFSIHLLICIFPCLLSFRCQHHPHVRHGQFYRRRTSLRQWNESRFDPVYR